METFVRKVIKEYDNACQEEEVAWERNDSGPLLRGFVIKDTRVKCPVCGKLFLPAPQHSYKQYKTKIRVCTYSCALKSEREYLGVYPRSLTLREEIELEEAEERAKEERCLLQQRAAVKEMSNAPNCDAPKKQRHERLRKRRPLTLDTLDV